jgi:hydroxyacylglutathione hydrolase
MKLIPLPAFTDNYIWMLHNGQDALVVDPGDATPVIEALREHGLRLKTILVTHHHADHTAGIAALRDATQARVYGPALEKIPPPFEGQHGGDSVDAMGLIWHVLDIPGHTAGHIAYFCDAMNGQPLVFCGDTLFSGGCGRLFEGTPAQMQASLATLSALPRDTLVCCTHEYTLSNLKFASEIEPGNADLTEYVQTCKALRARALPTLPTTIAIERRINPFLRIDSAAVIAAARCHDAEGVRLNGVFATLRQWKNQYQ